jgi:hypothetical protein
MVCGLQIDTTQLCASPFLAVNAMSILRHKANLQHRSVRFRLGLAIGIVLLGRGTSVGQISPYSDRPDAGGGPTFQMLDSAGAIPPLPQSIATPQYLPPANSIAPAMPQPQLVSNWQPAINSAVVPATPPASHERFIESNWYTRIDYFHWNERSGGADFVNEDGPLFTLGYLRRVGIERFRAEVFGSQVHYKADIDFGNGDVEPLSSHTNYLGVRGEYDLLIEPGAWPLLTFSTGIGTRYWIRDLPDDFTASGNFVEGYQETWWTIYPYLGVETREVPGHDFEFYGSGRIGVTAITLERATLNDVALYPKPGVIGQLEAGIRGEHLFVGAFFEGFSWQQSAVVRGWLQPNSKMYTVGLKTGFYF